MFKWNLAAARVCCRSSCRISAKRRRSRSSACANSNVSRLKLPGPALQFLRALGHFGFEGHVQVVQRLFRPLARGDVTGHVNTAHPPAVRVEQGGARDEEDDRRNAAPRPRPCVRGRRRGSARVGKTWAGRSVGGHIRNTSIRCTARGSGPSARPSRGCARTMRCCTSIMEMRSGTALKVRSHSSLRGSIPPGSACAVISTQYSIIWMTRPASSKIGNAWTSTFLAVPSLIVMDMLDNRGLTGPLDHLDRTGMIVRVAGACRGDGSWRSTWRPRCCRSLGPCGSPDARGNSPRQSHRGDTSENQARSAAGRRSVRRRRTRRARRFRGRMRPRTPRHRLGLPFCAMLRVFLHR